MKKISSTSCVCAALPWPGGTNMMLSVKCVGRDEVGAAVLAGAARADEAMLRAAVAVHARVGERVPVGLAVDEACDLALEELVEIGHGQRLASAASGASTRTGSPARTVPGASTRA